jgi:hypothetical protein
MSSASLSKMSVKLAGQPNEGLLMPKLKYRFRVTFQNFGPGDGTVLALTKQVVTFSRPNLTFEEIALPVYNSTVKLAGRHSWADTSCEIRDDANGQVTKLVGYQLQKQMDFMEMSSAQAGLDYKFTTTVEILDGGNGAYEPIVLETWQLYGCYLKGADYGSLGYAENAPVSITLSIAYDNANQTANANPDSTATGVGVFIGREVAEAINIPPATGAGV